ncbi:DDE-type integrase/transposase/recombinase [uncultured Erythrobacter sp.]|uniref:DDE-type integrase/transposase/recombinase n=1 Tax=uncultured Erythrobacter sp. TaxID=263913 RepID=UPI00265B6279|nr:DDE-type integrase/transposase/recombinase [uncultured Erythrobacter sp.]
MMDVRFPLSLQNVEDLLAERGIDICHETVRHWWNRFGPLFAADVWRQRVSRIEGFRQWKWHLDEVCVKINGEMRYLWRAVDQEGEVLVSYVTKTRDKQAALTFMKKTLKRHGSPETITSTSIATSQTARPTRPPAQPHWLNGRTSWPETSGKGGLRRSEMSCD